MVSIYLYRFGYFCLFGILTLGCPIEKDPLVDSPYTFNEPDESIKLPLLLMEISGLAYERDRLYAIQDEEGILFSWSLHNLKSFPDTMHFAGKNDYEGITIRDSVVYVITSTAKLRSFNLGSRQVNKLDAGISKNHNIEGLVYDSDRQGIWLASKENKSDPVKKIYFYDLSKEEVDKSKSIILDNSILKKFGQSQYPGLANAGKWIDYQFNPSGMAIHPITRELYILSSPSTQILVLDSDLNPLRLYFLNSFIHPQPEGVTFDNQGNLYIANEGHSGRGNLQVYYNSSR